MNVIIKRVVLTFVLMYLVYIVAMSALTLKGLDQLNDIVERIKDAHETRSVRPGDTPVGGRQGISP